MSTDNKSDTVPDKDASDGTVESSSTTVDVKKECIPTDQPSRVIFSDAQLDELNIEELRSSWRKQDKYIDSIETITKTLEAKIASLSGNEEKLKQQLSDLALKERMLMRRLAAKEQEMQEYASQLSEMKSSQAGPNLRSCLLDPTVNLLIQKLRQELSTLRTKLEDTQNELSAWKFTPDSNTGKRLMAKCRLLYQENEDLGRMISSGRLAKLEGELALQKSFSEEVKKSQSEMDELLQDLDEDVEGMQSTVYYLQEEVRRSRETGPTCNGLNGHSVVKNDRKRTASLSDDDSGSCQAKRARPPSPPSTPPPSNQQICANGSDPPSH